MKTFCTAVLSFGLVCLLSTTVNVQADEVEPQQLLKEIDQLKARIKVLEAQVRAMQQDSNPTKPSTSGDTRQVLSSEGDTNIKTIQPKSLPRQRLYKPTPQRIINLQFERPSELMRNIHSRERAIRQRRFPADVIPSPFQFR